MDEDQIAIPMSTDEPYPPFHVNLGNQSPMQYSEGVQVTRNEQGEIIAIRQHRTHSDTGITSFLKVLNFTLVGAITLLVVLVCLSGILMRALGEYEDDPVFYAFVSILMFILGVWFGKSNAIKQTIAATKKQEVLTV